LTTSDSPIIKKFTKIESNKDKLKDSENPKNSNSEHKSKNKSDNKSKGKSNSEKKDNKSAGIDYKFTSN
jgi:hypothetical protein